MSFCLVASSRSAAFDLSNSTISGSNFERRSLAIFFLSGASSVASCCLNLVTFAVTALLYEAISFCTDVTSTDTSFFGVTPAKKARIRK